MAMESIKKIVKRSIDDLIFAEYNPRQLSKEQFKYLKDSIHRFNVRLNKNTGDWDYDLLANNFDIEELSDWGFDDDDLKLFDADYGEDFDLPDGDKEPFRQVTFTLSDEQYEVVENALKKAKKNDFGETGNENSNGNALWWVCNSYEG